MISMGALGEPYASLADLKTYMSLSDQDAFDDVLQQALDSVSREIETHCGRQFNKADTATAREYEADARTWASVDDFWTTTGLVIESGTDYAQTWSATDYRLRPLNGIVDGQTGWPFSTVETGRRGSYRVDCSGLRVTAQWGWAAVPAPVKQACLIMAAETFQIKDAPFGVAGMDQFGAIRVRDNRMAASKLRRYCTNPILVG